MKKIYLILLFLFSFGLCYAQTHDSLSIEEQQRREKNIQAGNPFEKFGYKPKISTLSKGKYLEFHDQDSIVQIGSFTFHVKKKIITGYILKETKYSEATLRPEIVSRWFNPDPLSEEFPSWSPYTFTNNNPIFFTDPTGLAPEACCGSFMTGAGIGIVFNRIKRTAGYMNEGQSFGSAYARASGDDIVEGTKQTLRYVTPVEDLYALGTGKDFDNRDYNRAEAGTWAAASFLPFVKFGKLGKLAKVANKNGDEVIEISKDASNAFKEAVEGGTHSEWLKTYIGVEKKSLEKGVKSFNNEIVKHKNLIKDPAKYLKQYKGDDWNKLDPRHQKDLLNNRWPSDIKRLNQQRDILNDLSKQ